MKKNSFVTKVIHYDNKLDDGFVNLYKEGLFVRCFEYSAFLISQLTGYRLYANIDKKVGFVFLECGFTKAKLSEIQNELESKGYKIRIVEKDGNIIEIIGDNRLEKDSEKLINLKTNLIKF